VSYAPGKLKRITVRYSIVRGYRKTRPYQLAAPLRASLAFAIRGRGRRGAEGSAIGRYDCQRPGGALALSAMLSGSCFSTLLNPHQPAQLITPRPKPGSIRFLSGAASGLIAREEQRRQLRIVDGAAAVQCCGPRVRAITGEVLPLIG